MEQPWGQMASLYMFFKNGGAFIIDAVIDITRNSMDSGVIPEILRLGWITPLWKGSDSQNPINYRPISLTSHIGKGIEEIIRLQMQEYLVKNNDANINNIRFSGDKIALLR